MPIEQKFIRAEDHDDPERCRHGKHGACPFKVVPGTTACPRHGANKQLKAQEKVRVKLYKFNRFEERISELSNAQDIRSLREDLSVNRLLIEQLVNDCKTPSELIARSPQIATLTQNVSKMVMTWTQLEERLGLRLSMDELAEVADNIADAVSRIFSKILKPKKFKTRSKQVRNLLLLLMKSSRM